MASVVGLHPALGRAVDQLTRRRAARRPPLPRIVQDRTTLTQLLEGEIIPRLMVAHRADPVMAASPAAPHMITDEDVGTFAATAVGGSSEALLVLAERILSRPMSEETLFIDLMAPAARRLGQWWEDDRSDFVEVTMALWRMQEVVRELSTRFPPAARAGHYALFAAVPGDQHDFGASLMDEVFRRHGWNADFAVGAEMPALLDRVAGTWFDLIGLTVSCDCHIARLPSVIRALQSVSHNPRVRVMVGGRVFAEDPSLAARVGAHGTAADARLALAVASSLVEAAALAA